MKTGDQRVSVSSGEIRIFEWLAELRNQKRNLSGSKTYIYAAGNGEKGLNSGCESFQSALDLLKYGAFEEIGSPQEVFHKKVF